jgi:iron complex outermembrane recepter protein
MNGRASLLCAVSACAVGAAGQPARAQDTSATQVGEVVVTGSRVIRDSAQSPTPLTVTSAEQLAEAAPATIAEGIVQLPAFRGSFLPQGSGTSANAPGQGGSLLNLRGLGAQRTLILLDGRRVGASSASGVTDVSLLPETLVKRVEVVTGGASAAYGSDAVAGVVNFVLDTDFKGFKGAVQAGVSEYGDSDSYKMSLTLGSGFAAGRGHIVVSGDYYDREGIGPNASGRDWQDRAPGVIPNPTPGARPFRFFVDDVTLSAANYGGLITSGPLRGTTFAPGGAPVPFRFGSLVGPLFMTGGDGVAHSTNITGALRRATLFAHVKYDLAPSTEVFAEGLYAKVNSPFDQYYPFYYLGSAAQIQVDNAFVPAALRAQMTSLGLTSISVGRLYSEFPYIGSDVEREAKRLVGGFKHDFSERWSLRGYASHSETVLRINNQNDPMHRNFYAALDAVRDPASGRIVCRSTLSGLDPGCQPLNIFGVGAPSPEAIDYVLGDSYRRLRQKQDVAAITLQGETFSLWSDPIAFAAGLEYRREAAVQVVDALSSTRLDLTGIRGAPAALQGALGGYLVGNPQPIQGSYHIREGFLEVQAPIIADRPLIKRLELNGAVRLTDYSTSGSVTTWKVGAVYSPIEDVRLRFTRSRDIRAGNAGELFSGGVQTLLTVRDPATGQSVQITGLIRGNPVLDPEIADTFTAGVVYKPSQVPGLTIALDYYDIDMSGTIAQLAPQQVLDQCAQGFAVACSLITRVGGQIRLDLPQLNLGQLRTSGLDIEASYGAELAGGRLSLRAMANYVEKYRTSSPGLPPVDRVGQVGQSIGLPSIPKWIATFQATYDRGPWSLFVQERYIHHGLYDTAFVEGVDIDRNKIPHVWYTDVTLKRRFEAAGGEYELFATVNNLLNEDPPITPQVGASLIPAANPQLYDVLGRYYTVGLRFRY